MSGNLSSSLRWKAREAEEYFVIVISSANCNKQGKNFYNLDIAIFTTFFAVTFLYALTHIYLINERKQITSILPPIEDNL